jgi:hypothetical protein
VIGSLADGSSGVALMVENDLHGPLGVDATVDTTPAAQP